MILKLLPNQIPMVWNYVKYAYHRVFNIDGNDLVIITNELLHSLLSERSQCFVKLDNERKVNAIIITKVVVDKYTGTKQFLLEVVYAFQNTTISERFDDLDYFISQARKVNCSEITAYVNSSRVYNLMDKLGWVETGRSYKKQI